MHFLSSKSRTLGSIRGDTKRHGTAPFGSGNSTGKALHTAPRFSHIKLTPRPPKEKQPRRTALNRGHVMLAPSSSLHRLRSSATPQRFS